MTPTPSLIALRKEIDVIISRVLERLLSRLRITRKVYSLSNAPGSTQGGDIYEGIGNAVMRLEFYSILRSPTKSSWASTYLPPGLLSLEQYSENLGNIIEWAVPIHYEEDRVPRGRS